MFLVRVILGRVIVKRVIVGTANIHCVCFTFIMTTPTL